MCGARVGLYCLVQPEDIVAQNHTRWNAVRIKRPQMRSRSKQGHGGYEERLMQEVGVM